MDFKVYEPKVIFDFQMVATAPLRNHDQVHCDVSNSIKQAQTGINFLFACEETE
jgi:hypothetical protein